MGTTEFGTDKEIARGAVGLVVSVRRRIRRFCRGGVTSLAAWVATVLMKPRAARTSRDAFYSAALRG